MPVTIIDETAVNVTIEDVKVIATVSETNVNATVAEEKIAVTVDMLDGGGMGENFGTVTILN